MLSDLGWLPAPGHDFRERLKRLRAEASADIGEDFAPRLMSLATTALDDLQLSSMACVVASCVAGGHTIDGFTRLKVGLVGDGTLSLLGPAIAASAVRHGLLVDLIEGGYASAIQEASDPSSPIRDAGLDMVVIATDARLLGVDRAASDDDGATDRIGQALNRLRMIIDGLRKSAGMTVFVQTLVPLHEPLFGSYDRLEGGTSFAMVDAVNRALVEWARAGDILLIDIARLAQSVGLEHWHDPRHWLASKLSFSPSMLPVYGDVVARTLAAAQGKARKCLVLDLDNTLWGGVIGDDGLDGIALGQGSASGEAFLAVQQMALELRERGIVLAVCSKNEEDAARKPFREHPEMLLRETDIAVFQANWTDKATNLRAIAEALNVGLDALVFLDDNPAERAQVRHELPMVAVPELPDDPSLYPRILAAAGYFEAVAFSREDRERAGYYQANAERAALQSIVSDMASYLSSLDMVCRIAPVDAVSRARVAQLINKSNQFNLTTKRYSEGDVAAAEADDATHAFQIRLADRFGDNGIISVLIARDRGATWEIDSWLMSCRVLGRRVEEAALAHLARAATAAGARALIGRYVPTAKNRLVVDHYRKLGFAPNGDIPEGGTEWRLDLATYEAPILPMRIEEPAIAQTERAA